MHQYRLLLFVVSSLLMSCSSSSDRVPKPSAEAENNAALHELEEAWPDFEPQLETRQDYFLGLADYVYDFISSHPVGHNARPEFFATFNQAFAPNPPFPYDVAVDHLLLQDPAGPFWAVYIHQTLAKHLAALKRPPVAGKVKVYKQLSNGVIVDVVAGSGERCIFGIDLSTSLYHLAFHQGIADSLVGVTASQDEDLAELLDVLFVTHYHSDHTDPYLSFNIAKAAVDEGADKKVVIPQQIMDQLLTDANFAPYAAGFEVPDYNGVNTACNGRLSYRAMLGAQLAPPADNNVYLIEIDGFRVLVMGDQSLPGTYAFLQTHLPPNATLNLTQNLGSADQPQISDDFVTATTLHTAPFYEMAHYPSAFARITRKDELFVGDVVARDL